LVFDRTGVVIRAQIAALWSYSYDDKGHFFVSWFLRIFPRWRRKDRFSDALSGNILRCRHVALRRQRTFYAHGLFADDLSHGIIERKPEDFDVKVDGISGQVAFGPTPVGVFDDEADVGGQDEVVGIACDELEPALLKKGDERSEACIADLFARPARQLVAIDGSDGHSHFSSGVG